MSWFHSGERFPKRRQKWRRVANWLTHLHLEFWYQQTQESGNVYFWWAIILILDREFELAFELNLLAQWFNLLAQWFFLLRGKVTKSKVKTQVYGTRWKSGIN